MILSYKFFKFFTIYVFEVKKSFDDIPTELPCSADLKNPGQLPVQEVLRGTDNCVLWNFHNFSTIYVFKDKESIADIHTELTSLGDLENLQYRKLTQIFKVTRTRWFSRNIGNGFLNFENINTKEIVKIHKTKSSVPLRTS